MNEDGNAVGSISGRCVEGAVYDLCQQVLRDQAGPQRAWFGYSDDDAFAVGLTCGGERDVFVQIIEPERQLRLATTFAECTTGRPAAVAQVVDGPAEVVGATLSVLSQAARFLGYHVTVCDARPVFATPERFPHADEVVVDWPHRYLRQTAVDERTAICVLTHDAKFDIPLLRLALDLSVAYVGAMGSRRTHDDRLRRLHAEGLSDQQLARLHSPIGLDLGARRPEETAVSIAAEIIAHTNHATGLPLSRTTGPIHRDRAALTAALSRPSA